MAFADITLVCRECGNSFIFTAAEQDLYAQRGYEHQPGRCPACRAARRARATQAGSTGQVRGQSSGARQMYPAVCAACGAETEVPFQPRGDRPVYCLNCYRQRQMMA